MLRRCRKVAPGYELSIRVLRVLLDPLVINSGFKPFAFPTIAAKDASLRYKTDRPSTWTKTTPATFPVVPRDAPSQKARFRSIKAACSSVSGTGKIRL
jgi:hypothetical protein